MNQTIIVLGAKAWSLVDERTKQEREGVSLHYLMTDNLKPCVDESTGLEGYQPVKQSISLDAAKKLDKVPGVYNGNFELKASAGKTVLTLTSLEYVGAIKG